ncbi:MAG: YitT family protein [Oscillospiraceae bacterium]
MDKYLRPLSAVIEMLIGTMLTAAAFGLIIVPQSFAAGGITGFSRIIVNIIPIPLSVMVFILNMVLLILGFVFIGKKFVAKTVSISVLFPVMLEFFSHYTMNSIAKDTMLCATVAGVMLGIGSGLILRSGASSGGFDVLAVILNKKFKMPVATIMNICDAAVILMQSLNQPLSQTIYGIIVITISAAIVGRIVTMGTGESQIIIFSEHHTAIRNALLNELDVGMTSFSAETGYLQKQMKVIFSVVPFQKVVPIKRIILDVDPTAFVVIGETRSVLGRGYTLNRYNDHFPENDY